MRYAYLLPVLEVQNSKRTMLAAPFPGTKASISSAHVHLMRACLATPEWCDAYDARVVTFLESFLQTTLRPIF